MDAKHVSRRQFMGGAAAALGYLGLRPGGELFGEESSERRLGRYYQ